jgi:hypothetical protein
MSVIEGFHRLTNIALDRPQKGHTNKTDVTNCGLRSLTFKIHLLLYD